MPSRHLGRWFVQLCRSLSIASRKVPESHQFFRPRVEGLEDRLTPATFTVTNVNNAGVNSLRWAITESNSTPGANTINFDISGTGVKRINLLSALPTITNTVTIDGTTQTGFSSTPLIMVDGVLAGAAANGLVVDGANDCIVKGLVISQFHGSGIVLESNANVVQTCYIGTNATGSSAAPNGGDGILIEGSAANNTIGGTTTAALNVISENGGFGILMTGSGVTANTVEGNDIGTNASGNSALPNRYDGVALLHGTTNNIIGGTSSADFNFIAGNERYGVNISGTGTSGNIIDGDGIINNFSSGIVISAGASNNTIGGIAFGNVISANDGAGVVLTGAGVTGNIVEGNTIGTNGDATSALGNLTSGIELMDGARLNTIGGSAVGAENLISANGKYGILVAGKGTAGNTISGNVIGLDSSGDSALGNAAGGILIALAATDNTIGGTETTARNVISGNGGDGVLMTGVGVTGNVLEGNYIGTSVDGSTAEPNKLDGAAIAGGAIGDTIGGEDAGTGNLISGNGRYGVNISGAGTFGDSIFGNTIGLNALGTASLPNSTGVLINASGNTIGGISAGNTISGNKNDGILIYAASRTVVEGNEIGTLSNGTGTFGNGSQGVFITGGSANNTIGGTTSGAGNVIANNGEVGVLVGSDPSAGFKAAAGIGNAILGNSIFANAHLGIDLGPMNGVTPNHAAGLAAGPNHYQNYAVITSATTLSGGTQIQINVSLTSVPNTTFRIEVFANPTADPSGYGQGQNFLGYLEVTTNASGVATDSATFTYSSTLGSNISLTTTNEKTNDTSEFAQSVAAT